MKEEMDYLRYHSFLNAVTKEFEDCVDKNDERIQKKLLVLTIRVVDAFAEIYGDHDLKKASNPVSKNLVSREISLN